MMGLKDGVFHLSWFITYVLQVKFCHSLLCYIFCDGVGRNTLMLVSLYCIVGMEQYAIFPMIWCLWLERNDRIFNDVLTLVDLHSKGPISCIPPMSSLFSFFYLLVTRVGWCIICFGYPKYYYNLFHKYFLMNNYYHYC